MDERPAIAFIGAGRVAGVLAPAFAELGYPVVAAASRSLESAGRVTALVPGCPLPTSQATASNWRSLSVS